MTATSIAFIAAGAYVAYKSVIQPASAAGTLNFYPANAKSLRFDGLTPVITIGIAIQNPSNQTYTIKSLVGNIYANGYLIGNVSSFFQMAIKPTGETVYPITVRLSLIGIVQDIIAAFNGGGIQQEVELQANANVNNFIFPVKIKYHIP